MGRWPELKGRSKWDAPQGLLHCSLFIFPKSVLSDQRLILSKPSSSCLVMAKAARSNNTSTCPKYWLYFLANEHSTKGCWRLRLLHGISAQTHCSPLNIIFCCRGICRRTCPGAGEGVLLGNTGPVHHLREKKDLETSWCKNALRGRVTSLTPWGAWGQAGFPMPASSVLGRSSHVQLFATLWTVACQAPLSMGFSRQKSWSELSCPPSPGHLPNPGIKPTTLTSPAWAGSFFSTRATWEAH